MPPPASVFHQPNVHVTAVPAWSLVPSPRNYNASILEFEGRRLMAYRSHRMDQGGRCGIVICELADDGDQGPGTRDQRPKPKTQNPKPSEPWAAKWNQWIDLPEQVHSQMVHHEDPRLFVFKGRLHLAYTETQFHPAPRPYTCVMKYARLREVRVKVKVKGKVTSRWTVERNFWPQYGRNDGSHQEKNWQFFEAGKLLHVIYQAEPHVVLELDADGESVRQVHNSEGGVKWPWGTIRGGTPPMRIESEGSWAGHMLTVFHSATPYPIAPFWRRYYAGAYVFEPQPPFRIVAISHKPILVGSEHDGHAHDPRNIDSWKPFVVFPSGIIAKSNSKPGKRKAHAGWWVSYGINDFKTVIVEHQDFYLGDPGFESWGTKYFRTENGSTPVRYFVTEDRPPTWLKWDPVRTQMRAGACPGVLAVRDARVALLLQEEAANVSEISEAEYRALRA